MFAPTVGRVLRNTSCLSAASNGGFARAALNTAAQSVFKPTHQRRLSSSKPSTPPNNKKKPAEIDQNASAKDATKDNASELHSTKAANVPGNKLKRRSNATTQNNIPSVQPTDHLRETGL